MTKAQRTREALRDVALDHFQRDGVAGADVTAIAAEAGVTERTFWRHFATKDEVLFGDVNEQLEWLRALLRGRPGDEDLVDGLLLALQASPRPAATLDLARLRADLLSRERVESWLRELQGQLCAELEDLLLDRGHEALDARLRAQVLSGATFAALTTWMDEGGRLTDLLPTVTAALERVRPVVSDPARPGARGTRSRRGSRAG